MRRRRRGRRKPRRVWWRRSIGECGVGGDGAYAGRSWWPGRRRRSWTPQDIDASGARGTERTGEQGFGAFRVRNHQGGELDSKKCNNFVLHINSLGLCFQAFYS